MSMPSLSRATAIPVVIVLGLSACAAQPTGPSETFAPVPPTAVEPAPAITANPIEPDTLLIVRATATASTGAALALEMQVHQSKAFDDVANQTLPGALIDDCGATLNADLFASQAWSFTRANITAIPTSSSTVEWPAATTISVEPSADFAMISGRGSLATDTATPCHLSKSFAGPGRGALSMGIAGDSGTFTAWTGHSWGFAIEGATLSDCSFETTALGTQLGGDTNWIKAIDDSTCVVGPATQVQAY